VKEGLAGKIVALRRPALAGPGENRYIDGNLWFSYDHVLRVGPFRTRSFLLPERT
jgi:hypothetical protein